MSLMLILSAIVPNEYVFEPHQAQSLLQYYLNLAYDGGMFNKHRMLHIAECIREPDRVAYANSNRVQ